MQPGERIDRFVLLGELGRGGMSIVYAAWDPDLDRRIALKLMHTEATGSGPTLGTARLRLQREAQAIAKVSHENVIVIYDVGTTGDEVFIAEELVDGTTLRGWIDERPRGWREVLGVMTQAGRGLAAAHAAGLVHRDFKPENVLVGKDGRIRVTDFGLARPPVELAGDTDEIGEPPTLPDGDGIDVLGETAIGQRSTGSLTEAGALVGTPRYMSPEQLHGRPADARSDQFSFCVVLYEALWRQRPFTGETVGELRRAVDTDRPAPPPAEVRVPSWLRRTILRGLRASPDQRFASMSELLGELRRDRPAVQRLAIAGVVAAGLAAAAAIAWPRDDEPAPPPCAGARQALDGVWDAAARQRVERAFLATGTPYAADAWTGVERALDQRAERWIAGHVDACEAANVRRTQSPAALDLRMACLARRRSELSAFVELLGSADAAAVERAVAAAGELPAVEVCADLATLMARLPPPDDPAIAAQVQAVRARHDRARALGEIGHYREGLELAEAALVDARATGYLPVIAEAERWVGDLATETRDLTRAHEQLLAALEHALAADHEPVAAEAASALLYLTTQLMGRRDEAEVFLAAARGMRERIAGDRELEHRLTVHIAQALVLTGRYDAARVESDRGLDLALRLGGEKSVATAEALTVRGNVISEAGDLGSAIADYRRSAEILQGLLGDQHPTLAVSLYDLGLVLRQKGSFDEALEKLHAAKAIFERVGDGILVAYCAHHLARAHQDKGELDLALAGYRAVLEEGERLIGPDAADLAYPLTGIGAVLRRKGELDAAEPPLRRALALREKWFPADSPVLAETLSELGLLLHQRGRRAEAAPMLARVLDVCAALPCRDIDLPAVRAAAGR